MMPNAMTFISAIMTAMFDFLLRPFAGLSPWYGIAAVSLLTGVVMLLIFRCTSNQRAIRRAKQRIRAHLLEVRLYRDDVRVLLRAQKDILLNNLAYLGNSLAPLAVMIIPVVLILVQLNAHYGYQPLRPNESGIVSARFAHTADLDTCRLELIVPSGLRVETPPLRIPSLREVDWRIGAKRPGKYVLAIAVGEQRVEKQVVVAAGPARVAPERVASGWSAMLMNPGEKPLPHGSVVRSITVGYKRASLPLLRWNIHWLVAFFVLSIAFGFALKGLFRVEV
jgi:uncharacterized membrane protein (DUF106 family)